MSAEPDDFDLPPYVPVERTDILVRCQRCGAVVEGDVVGQNQHDIWHNGLNDKIEKAARWKPAPRYGGQSRAASQPEQMSENALVQRQIRSSAHSRLEGER